MQKIGSSTSTADEHGEFTDGDPQREISCTWVMAAWLNTLQRELVHLCEEAGITLDPADDTQVYQAISALLNDGVKGLVKSVNTLTPDTAGNVTLTPTDIGSLPTDGTAAAATKLATAHKIAGHPFDGTADISIAASDVGALATDGTAAAATKLATARKIAGHPFDGTADINISGSDVGLDKVGNFAAVQQGGGAGMGTNKVYIGWTGSKVKIQVDASDMGEVYTTVNPPPVTSVVTDSRQGALQDIGHLGDGQNIAPAGCSLIGLAHNGSSDTKNMGLYCAANQICINGNWRTIERL